MRPSFRLGAALIWLLWFIAYPAEVRLFPISGSETLLERSPSGVAVLLKAMRPNRSTGRWDVDLMVTNGTSEAIRPPLVLAVDASSGTAPGISGVASLPDGSLYLDLTSLMAGRSISPGGSLTGFTLTLGDGRIRPSVSFSVFAGTDRHLPTATPDVFRVRQGHGPQELDLLANDDTAPDVGEVLRIVGVGPAAHGRVTIVPAGDRVVYVPNPGYTGPDDFSYTVNDGTAGSDAKGRVTVMVDAGLPALVLVRTLSKDGVPVGGVPVRELGPADPVEVKSSRLGWLSLQARSGVRGWVFESPGFEPVIRTAADLAAGSALEVPTVRLVPRSPGDMARFPLHSLPVPIPRGWSPVWCVRGGAGIHDIAPDAPVAVGRDLVLARWDDSALVWRMNRRLSSQGGTEIGVELPEAGIYALMLPDRVPLAPEIPEAGGVIEGILARSFPSSELRANGRVEPASRNASRDAALVTAQGEVDIVATSGPLSSGSAFPCQVTEEYRLRDGTRRLLPTYSLQLVGFRRPEGPDDGPLRARFPLRPLQLLSGDELDEVRIRVEVLPPSTFSGVILEESGGLVSNGGFTVVAKAGDLPRPEAAMLRQVVPVDAGPYLPSGSELGGIFELAVTDLPAGKRFELRTEPVAVDRRWVLARAVFDEGRHGFQPVQRFASDSAGRLLAEPGDADGGLPGIDGGGQYWLLSVQGKQAVVTGTVRDREGRPVPGAWVQLGAWTAFTGSSGRFQLLAPEGKTDMAVADPTTGDINRALVTVPSDPSTVLADVTVGPVGLRVVEISPADGATGISTVTAITLRFSRSLNPSTLVGDAVRLMGPDGLPVPTSLSVNLARNGVTVLPTSPLAPGAAFEIILADTVSDVAGSRIEAARRFRFSTEAGSIRKSDARLIIYEPLNGLAGMSGEPGLAEPESAVILLNETTGVTATVLSKPDGSFTNQIPAGVDDLLSAVIINRNGTRNTVPATRQIFRDGFVGLYSQGGSLEAQRSASLGESSVIIPSGGIPTKTQFRVSAVSIADLQAIVDAARPESAQLAGQAMKVEIRGDRAGGRSDVEMAVDPDDLGLPPGVDPSEGAYCLAMVREIDGQKVYQVVDRMKYRDGKLFTNTEPFGGWMEAADLLRGSLPGSTAFDFFLVPLFLGTKPITVSGLVAEAPTIPGGNRLSNLLADALLQGQARLLSGAFVTLDRVGQDNGRAGRIRPGMVYATSGADGVYVMVAPSGTSGSISDGYVVRATHPRFDERPSEPIAIQLDFSLAGIIRKDLIFRKPLDFMLPPRVNVSHAPRFPGPGDSCTVEVNASHGAAVPPTVDVRIKAVAPIGGGVASTTNAVILEEVSQVIGNRRRWTAKLVSTNAMKVTLEIRSASGVAGSNLAATNLYSVIFGGVESRGTNAIPASDPNDTVGPMVISTFPAEGERLDESATIRISFNEPIDSTVVSNASSGITVSGTGFVPSPALRLSEDQRTLSLTLAGLAPDSPFSLTLNGSAIQDLLGNPLDQKPSTSTADAFLMSFRSAAQRTVDLPGISNGGGAALSGSRLYALARGGEDALLVFDVSLPASPRLLSKTPLPGTPRDLVVITNYSYLRKNGGPVETNELVAVVGGNLTVSTDDIGNVFTGGQYLRLYSMRDASSPERLVSPQITLRPTTVTKVIWDAPNLIYQELGSDIQQVGVVDLQEMLIGLLATPEELGSFPRDGRMGKDRNSDGDYADEGDVVPLPPRSPAEFFGKRLGFTFNPVNDRVQDFSSSGGMMGVVLSGNLQAGGTNPPAYRTVSFGGQAPNARAATFPYPPGSVPKRVSVFDFLSIQTPAGIQQLAVALVSLAPDAEGKARLSVLDISLPESPRELSRIGFPEEMVDGFLQSVRMNPAGQLEVSTSQNVILLDPLLLAERTPSDGRLHPSIVGFIRGAGSGNHSLGLGNLGLRAVNLGGRHVLVQSPPKLSFVTLTNQTAYLDASRLSSGDVDAGTLMAAIETVPALMPAQVRAMAGVTSDLSPPNPSVHYHVLVEAPGGAGATLSLGLESLDRAGRPRSSFGLNFPPVRLVSPSTFSQLRLTQRDCDAPVQELTAYRLSSDLTSPFYNLYLSKAFVVVAEKVSKPELETLRDSGKREILWTGASVRAFIDPSSSFNPAVGPFAATVETSRNQLIPSAVSVVPGLDATYVMGNNPPPLGGAAAMPGSFGSVSAHSGEFRTEAVDLTVPSRRMPIEIRRTIGGQDLYEGPFGRGWDFNYNERLEELKPQYVPPGRSRPLIEGPSPEDHIIAESRAILFHTGEGRIIRFEHKGRSMPPEMASDPLVLELGWAGRASDYYLPEPGTFDLLVKFRDGCYERLTPEGVRHRYGANGRLESIIDRHPQNRHVLEYDRGGRLVRIIDKSVTEDRYVVFGYHRFAGDTDFNQVESGIDVATDNPFHEGRIYRIRDHAGSELEYHYDSDGALVERLGTPVSGANGGFSGRQKITYDYSACEMRGVRPTSSGVPIFSVSNIRSSDGKSVATGGSGAGGSATFSIPVDNSSRDNEGRVTRATQGDQTTEFTFDKRGNPKKTKRTANGATFEEETDFDANGLLRFQRFPEGSSVTYAYDSANPNFRSRGNRLTSHYEPGPRGGTAVDQSWSYDPKYNLPSGSHVDENGNRIVYTLTSDQREIESIRYEGVRAPHAFTYNEYGQVLSEDLPTGIRTTFTYDSTTGYTLSVQHGNDRYDYSYNSTLAGRLGMPTTIRPPENLPWDAEYDANLQRTRLSRGRYVETRAYDEQGLLKTESRDLGDGRVRTVSNEFDERAFLKKTTISGVDVDGSPSDVIYQYVPDALSRVQKIIHPGGTEQAFEYDGIGNVIKMTLGDYSEEYRHDGHGNVIELKIGGQVVETKEYDGFDRVLKVRRKVTGGEEVQENSYHPGGELRKTTIEDPVYGRVFEKEVASIDALGRPLRVDFPGTEFSGSYDYRYDRGSFSITGPQQTTHNQWNEAGNPTGYADGNLTVVQQPTANGKVRRVDRTEDGARFFTEFAYDSMDNPTSQSDGMGTLFQFVPNPDGTVKRVTNARSNGTDQDFTALGELSSRRRADGMEFRITRSSRRDIRFSGSPRRGYAFDFDDSFRLKTKRLPGGGRVEFSNFDPRNLPRTIQLPSSGSMTVTYDLQGRVTSKAAQFSGISQSMTFARDALDRVREATYGSGGGNASTATFDYDLAGPMTRARYQEEGQDFEVRYHHRNDGTRKGVDYPSGIAVEERRDAAGRLTELVVDGQTLERVLAWNGNANPREVQIGSSIRILNHHDARGRLLASRHTGSGGKLISDIRQQVDDAGNVEARQHVHRGFRVDLFAYDNGERILDATLGAMPRGSGIEARPEGVYLPDLGFGPGKYSRHFTYDPSGEDYLTTVGGVEASGFQVPPMAGSFSGHDAFLHAVRIDGLDRGSPDGLGNVLRTPLHHRDPNASIPQRLVCDLVHDAFGRLAKVTFPDGRVLENLYQPSGLRYLKRVTQGSQLLSATWFVYDTESRLIEEHQSQSGGPVQLVGRYFYFDSDVPVAADLRDPVTGNLTRVYYVTDSIGSVTALATENGDVIERVEYDVFGQPTLHAKDVLPPRVASVVRGVGGEILVTFSETLVPALADPGVGPNLQRPTFDMSTVLSFVETDTGAAVPGTVRFVESGPGLGFGETFRFLPQGTSSTNVTLIVRQGRVADEWGNSNLGQSIPVDFSLVAPGSVLFDVTRLGSTSPGLKAVSGLHSPFLFQGQYLDYETGLYYLRARFFDPYTGQFLEPDPQGFEDSVNLYAGLGNNPVNLRDPSGLAVRPNRVVSQATRATRAAERSQTAAFLTSRGLTDLEIDAISNVLARRRQDIRLSIRSFGAKAPHRRKNASAGMPNKPAYEKRKTDGKSLLIAESPSGNQIQVTSDLDILHLEINGRMANQKDAQQLIGEMNREYNRLFRESELGQRRVRIVGADGVVSEVPEFKPNPPFQHGTHTGMAQLYGQEFLGKPVDSTYIAKVGHPGESFTFKTSGGGHGRQIGAYDTPHWQTQLDLNEAEKILKERQHIMKEYGTGWPVAIDPEGRVAPESAWDKWSYEKPPGAWKKH